MLGIAKKSVTNYKNEEELAIDLSAGDHKDLDSIGQTGYSKILRDADLESLVDYLEEGDFSKGQVERLVNQQYGDFIDFYYLKDENLYVMQLGAR